MLNRDEPRSASCIATSDEGVDCAMISFEDYDRVVSTNAFSDALKDEFEQRDKGTFSDAKLSDLEVLRELGFGSYGNVFLVRHSVTGRVCAVKEISIEKVQATNNGIYIERERSLILSLRHPFIVKVLGQFISPTHVYLALDAILGGELLPAINTNYDVISKSTSVRFYVAQVVEIFSYLHRSHIAYRDLKPENLLIGKDGYLTMIDFSVAKKTKGECFTLIGTPEYTAPEVYRMTGHSTSCDWWSLGVLMHELSVGEPPFQGNNTIEIMEAIAEYERLYPDSVYFRDEADDLNKITVASEKMVKGLLCPKPYNRLGSSSHNNIEDIMSHPFFNGFNWRSLRAKTMNPPFIPHIGSKYDGQNFDYENGDNNNQKESVETNYRSLGNDLEVDKDCLPKWAQNYVKKA